MTIDNDLMVALRSGPTALGRLVESEVVAIIGHLATLGWTAPAPVAPPPALPPLPPTPPAL